MNSNDGLSLTFCLYCQIFIAQSGFFTAKLSDRWSKKQRASVYDCDDVEVYLETLFLICCKDLCRRLMRKVVGKVLCISAF